MSAANVIPSYEIMYNVRLGRLEFILKTWGDRELDMAFDMTQPFGIFVDTMIELTLRRT